MEIPDIPDKDENAKEAARRVLIVPSDMVEYFTQNYDDGQDILEDKDIRSDDQNFDY